MKHIDNGKRKVCNSCKHSYRVHYNHLVVHRCKAQKDKVVKTTTSCEKHEYRIDNEN